MRCHTSLDPESEVEIQQTVDFFLGQSTGDIRQKLQKIQGPDRMNLETLLDETWRVFSNQEEGYKQGMRKFVAVISERGRFRQEPPRQGPSQLGRDQCAMCEKYGHWKINAQNEVGVAFRKRETRKREKCTCGRRLRRTSRSHSRRFTGYKFEAGGKRKAGEILVDMRAIYSALNKILAPVGENHVTVIGATGQPEKAYFCKPVKFTLGKQWGIHKFLYLPSSPIHLLGRHLLEQLQVILKCKNEKVILEVNDEQYVEALSLMLTALMLMSNGGRN